MVTKGTSYNNLKKYSDTFPHTNCKISSKKHVQQIFTLVRYFEPISFSNNYVPGWTKLLIHSFFYHACSKLKKQNSLDDSFLDKYFVPLITIQKTYYASIKTE